MMVVLLTGLSIMLHSYGGGGILSGFLHPLLGIDHLLAMIAVGMISAQLGGRAIWTVPATFVGAMTVGGLLGLASAPLPLVELGIASSVVLLGVAIAANRSLPVTAVMIIVALFGLFHGHAHGTELPAASDTIALVAAYVTGFLTATIGLHVIGALLGMIAIGSKRGSAVLRVTGGVIASLGVLIVSGVI